MVVRELLENQCRKTPGKVFLYFGDQQITYEDFNKNVNRASNVFLDLGVKKGDRVCFMLPNCPEFLYGWFGLAKIGAVLVPMNVHYRAEEAKYLVDHSEAETVFVHSAYKDTMDRILPETPLVKRCVSLGGRFDGSVSFEEAFQSASHELAPFDIDEDDLCEIMYTSGTTGPSKGVMMTHKYMLLTGRGYSYPMQIQPEDRVFTCLPLFHANAQGYSTMGALVSGASLVLVDRFSASRFWEQIRHYKATIFNYIGAMMYILNKQPESEKDRDHHIRAAYGTPSFDKEFHDYLEKRFGIKMVSGYGLTECGVCLIQPMGDSQKTKSMGIPKQIPGADFTNEVRVVDENDRPVPANTVGEIVIRNPAVMKGYYRDPELTREVMRNGWLHTGDFAWMDEDGFFYFADRKKHVIRRRGENVSSIEVENVLNAHPDILESAVIGVPSEVYDDEVKAFIVPRSEKTPDPLDIIKWCNERLAYFKVPRFIEFRDEFPKTPTLRVQKYKLLSDHAPNCFDLQKTNYKLK